MQAFSACNVHEESAVEDEQDRYLADASISAAHHPQQGASPSTETVTCSSAAPPASSTSLEGPPDGCDEAGDTADDPVSDPVGNVKSEEHKAYMLSLSHRGKGIRTVDVSMATEMETARQYWREVLKRVVAVIKFLGERGLPFRGDSELLGSSHNGNFLGILELISQFDPFLAGHIKKYKQEGQGIVSYLSSTICEEFIDVMADKTRQIIAEEIQDAKCFSVVVDSTPDLSHVDQLTLFSDL